MFSDGQIEEVTHRGWTHEFSTQLDGSGIVIFALDYDSFSFEGLVHLHSIVEEAEYLETPIWIVIDIQDISWSPTVVQARDFAKSLTLFHGGFVKGIVFCFERSWAIDTVRAIETNIQFPLVVHTTDSLFSAISYIKSHDDSVR